MNWFKRSDLVDRVPENYGWRSITWYRSQWPKPYKTKRNARRQSGCLRRLYTQLRKEEKQRAREKGNDIPTECRVLENSRRDKKAFVNEECKEVEENNKMGKTKDLFKKVGDIKGTFHSRTGPIKDIIGKDLKEAEEIFLKRGGKNIQKNYTKKILITQITTMVW